MKLTLQAQICLGLEVLGYKRDERRVAQGRIIFLDHVRPGNQRLYIGSRGSLRGGIAIAASVPLDNLKAKAIEAAKGSIRRAEMTSPADPLERVIRPIVEGQIRGFIKEHPSILKGVNWFKPNSDKAMVLTNSLAKRITRDLLSSTTRGRMAAALLAERPGKPFDGVSGIDPGASPPRLEESTGLGGRAK